MKLYEIGKIVQKLSGERISKEEHESEQPIHASFWYFDSP